MISKNLPDVAISKYGTLKFFGAVTTSTAAANAAKLYYFKPSFPCKFLNAKLHVVTAAPSDLACTFTKETAVTDADLPWDTITVSTSVSAGTACSNDDFAALQTGTAATITINSTPGANHVGTENHFYPDDNDALLFTIADANSDTMMAATLELEFIPI